MNEFYKVRGLKGLAILMAAVCFGFWGCNDDSADSKDNKDNKTTVEQCKEDKDCADQKDGKTHCDTDKGECVKPAGQGEDEQKKCGNGEIDGDELCDKTVFKGGENSAFCVEWDVMKYAAGKVKCKDDCTIDYSECVAKQISADCGNDTLDGEEACDKSKFKDDKTACVAWDSTSYSAGDVKCKKDCTVDFSECESKSGSTCGNGRVDNGENCDADKFLEDKTDCSAWDEKYKDGKVSCNKCVISYDNCVLKETTAACNNGVVEGEEACDKSKFKDDKTTCAQWDDKYKSGEVSCKDDCSVDFSQCSETASTKCGNDKLDKGEVCDGTHFSYNKKRCATLFPEKYSAGNVTCHSDCTYNEDACEPIQEPVCKNGTLESGELCDGTKFKGNKKTCAAWDDKYTSGNVSCKDDCTIDYSECVEGGETGDDSCSENGATDCVEGTRTIKTCDAGKWKESTCPDDKSICLTNSTTNKKECTHLGYGEYGCRFNDFEPYIDSEDNLVFCTFKRKGGSTWTYSDGTDGWLITQGCDGMCEMAMDGKGAELFPESCPKNKKGTTKTYDYQCNSDGLGYCHALLQCKEGSDGNYKWFIVPGTYSGGENGTLTPTAE